MKKNLALIGVSASLAACAVIDSGSNGTQSNMTMASSGMSFHEPIDLMPLATGELSWKISTANRTAQAYFDQGLQLRYAFGVDDAARSFHEAHQADPDCAMCYWGEAYALGSYLNGPITVAKAPYALAAIQKAAELAVGNATPMERELIEATLPRYVDNYTTDMKPALDQAFASSMQSVYETHPDDLNITAIYANALFVMEPRRGTREMDDPRVMRLHGVLEDGLAKDIKHPGLCHLYIHATESTVQPELAEPCAEFISAAIPGASHINHMPSHTWNEVGRWNDSILANQTAWISDLKAAVGEGVSIYPTHNLHMMLFSASMDGQGAIATQAGKDYAKISGNTMYQALTLIRFGRFDEVAAVGNRPEGDVFASMWDFSVGYASLREGDGRRAREVADDLLSLAETTEAMFRFHQGGLIIATLGHLLAGEIERADGNLEAAVAELRRAVEVEDQIGYDEPEPLPFAARHWYGAVLLEVGRYADAERIYREELADHPHNVWSLHGLKAALAGQDKQDPLVDQDFAASTAREDLWITDSRF
jgi:tetratricopeptide (TPR) repeat protein